MAEEGNYQEEERGINRRNFLKNAGVVVTGSTLAAGMTLTPEPRPQKQSRRFPPP